MPRLTYSESLAAGATARPLQNWQYEYLPWAANVRVILAASLTGVEASVSSGSEQIMRQCPVSCRGALAIDALPAPLDIDPLHFVAPAGDRLDLSIVNTSGGAIIVHAVVDVNPG